jgi:TM2 domain-containing membrane protein YozV
MVRALAILGLLLLFIYAKADGNKSNKLFAINLKSQKEVPGIIPKKAFQLKHKLRKEFDDADKSRVLAAILSFPLPFGVFGIHRSYLETSSVIPVVYIVTFGGGFGILPFIDFTIILLSEDLKPYVENTKLLMWNKEKP